MSIRIRTLEGLTRGRKQIPRVRWRVVSRDAGGAAVADADGVAADPSTWSRWEEEYYVRVDLAREALKRDPHGHVRPRGIIDRVAARELWDALSAESRELYEDGIFRVLYARLGGPGRLQSDVTGTHVR